MAKKKEKRIKDVETVPDVAKDIDDIFATKKVVTSPSEPPTKRPQKSVKVQSSGTTMTVRSTDDDLATVQGQVRAVKSAQSNKSSHVTKEDDFSDIRGTKKRTRDLLDLSYWQENEPLMA